jgi:hypothetical protein
MALRFTFTEQTEEYDALQRPIMAHLGTLIRDSDLVRDGSCVQLGLSRLLTTRQWIMPFGADHPFSLHADGAACFAASAQLAGAQQARHRARPARRALPGALQRHRHPRTPLIVPAQ